MKNISNYKEYNNNNFKESNNNFKQSNINLSNIGLSNNQYKTNEHNNSITNKEIIQNNMLNFVLTLVKKRKSIIVDPFEIIDLYINTTVSNYNINNTFYSNRILIINNFSFEHILILHLFLKK